MIRFVIIFFMFKMVLFAEPQSLQTIAFGSCANQNAPQPVWSAINKNRPDLMIMLGDNVYADVDDAWIKSAHDGNVTDALTQKVKKHFQAQYDLLSKKKEFIELKKKTPFIATWDDHDFGKDDIGKTFPFKEISKEIFLDFWDEPVDSLRRSQQDGVYTSYYYGDKDKRVQIILLDTRFMRDALYRVDPEHRKIRDTYNVGPYLANPDEKVRMLGDVQWQWLEAELAKPADLRIIGSSIQFLSDFTGWESWSNFPKERERLIHLIDKQSAKHVVFISGDTHWSEFSKLERVNSYPLWELTSSGINMEWRKVSPNRNRVSKAYVGSNFGLILIDWREGPSLTMQIRDENNTLVMQRHINFKEKN